MSDLLLNVILSAAKDLGFKMLHCVQHDKRSKPKRYLHFHPTAGAALGMVVYPSNELTINK